MTRRSEEEDQEYESFSTDSDFVGGRWIDGEFYFEKERSKKKLSKEDHLYGIFNDNNDNNSDDRYASEDSAFKPMNFVSSSSFQKQQQQQNEKSHQFDGDDDDVVMIDDDDNNNDNDNGDDTTQDDYRSNDTHGDEGAQEAQQATLPKTPSYQVIIGTPSAAAAAAASTSTSSRTSSQTSSNRRPHIKKDEQFGSWLTTSGKVGETVLKQMLKMGWDPTTARLGKHSTGIVNPIDVKLRRRNMGIQESNELTPQQRREFAKTTTTTALGEYDDAVSPIEEKDRRQMSTTKKTTTTTTTTTASSRSQRSLLKKKSQSDKAVIYKFKSSDDLISEQDDDDGGNLISQQPRSLPPEAKKMKIIDLTGEEIRVYSSFDDIRKDSTRPTKADRHFLLNRAVLPELQYNVRELISTTEADIHDLGVKLRREKDRLVSFEHEHKILEKQSSNQKEKLQRLQHIHDILNRCQARITEASAATTTTTTTLPSSTTSEDKTTNASSQLYTPERLLTFLAGVFEMLQYKFPEEYESYRLAQVAVAMVIPVLQSKFEAWRPLSEPSFGVDIFSKWKQVLFDSATAAKRSTLNTVTISTAENIPNEYCTMLQKIVLPKLRSAITNDWNCRDPESAITLLELWHPLLPTTFAEHILDQVILHRISSAVDAWNPRVDMVPIHSWIHPWLVLLSHKFQAHGIFNTIRFKLASVLREWHPSDMSAHLILEPWKGVFDSKTMDTFVARSIVPKLSLVMKGLTINPQNQDLDPIRWVMRWTDLISPYHFVTMLESHFFPKFYQVLYTWLTGDPNFEEVSDWFTAWKQELPEVLQRQDRIRQLFRAALDMMNTAASSQPLDLAIPMRVLSSSSNVNSDLESLKQTV